MTEQQILEAELATRQKEVGELEGTLGNLEATLVNLNQELETLEQFLAERQETGPSEETLPEVIDDTPIVRTPSTADSILLMTYREWKPTFVIEAPKVVVEEPVVLAEPELIKEEILSVDWLKKNWALIGIGLVGLSLFVTIAKD